MPITLDKKVETAILETASRSHVIIIDGQFVGITRGKRQSKRHGATVKVGKSVVVSTGRNQHQSLIGFSKSKEKIDTPIESFLRISVKEKGYKEVISAFLAGFGQTKLEEYKRRFQNLEKNYKLALEKYKENHNCNPIFTDFENLDYLFIEDSKILLDILEALVKKEEIPYEIYEKLSYIDKLNSLRFLKKDWDSYGAPKINPKIISQAIEFIETYKSYYTYLDFVAPLNNGGVHIAFEKENKQVKINFDSEGNARVKVKTDGNMTVIPYKKSNYSKILKDNL